MSLFDALSRFADELDVQMGLFEDFVASHPTVTSSSVLSVGDECFLEGNLSRLWQAWGDFWRDCFLESCLGTVDGNGVAIPPHPDAISSARVSSASIRAKKGKLPYWQGSNLVLRFEPTWGDTDALTTIISRLIPTNSPQLLAAVSSAHTSAKKLQTIRNCAAHTNAQTMAEVIAFQTSYLSFPITHPVHALFWIDPTSNDYLMIQVIDDLKQSALAAIS